MLYFSGKRKNFGAAAASSAKRCKPLRAVEENRRNIGEGLDIVDDGRFAPEAAVCRIGGPRTRLAALALDRMNKGGFFAADKCACSEAKLKIKIKTAVQYVLAKQAMLAAQLDGFFKPLDGHRILGPDIDKSLVGGNGESADDHAFNYAERITLEHAAVHKCSRVAFVGIADDVAGAFGGAGGHCPFLGGGISSSASSAKVGFGQFINDPCLIGLAKTAASALNPSQ